MNNLERLAALRTTQPKKSPVRKDLRGCTSCCDKMLMKMKEAEQERRRMELKNIAGKGERLS